MELLTVGELSYHIHIRRCSQRTNLLKATPSPGILTMVILSKRLIVANSNPDWHSIVRWKACFKRGRQFYKQPLTTSSWWLMILTPYVLTIFFLFSRSNRLYSSKALPTDISADYSRNLTHNWPGKRHCKGMEELLLVMLYTMISICKIIRRINLASELYCGHVLSDRYMNVLNKMELEDLGNRSHSKFN